MTSTYWSAALNPRLGIGPEFPSLALRGRGFEKTWRGFIVGMPGIAMEIQTKAEV